MYLVETNSLADNFFYFVFSSYCRGKDKGAFFHEKFQHGKRSLCRKIHRKRASRKSSASQGSSSSLSQLASGVGSGLSTSAWGRTVAASQSSRGSASTRLGSAASLGLGGPPSQAMGLSTYPSSASLQLRQQQQLQQLREQEELVAQLLERQRRASSGSRHDPPGR